MTWKPSAHADTIRRLAPSCTPKQLAEATGLTESAIRGFCNRHALAYVRERPESTPENDEAIRAGAEALKSMSRVAEELGVSRSAVAGRAGRLGIQFKSVPDRSELAAAGRKGAAVVKAKAAPKPPKPIYSGDPKTSPLKKKLDAITANTVARATYREGPEPAGEVTMLELEPHHCRWPIGDPQADTFRLCGEHRREGSSYCEGHHRKAYAKPSPPPVNATQRRIAA